MTIDAAGQDKKQDLKEREQLLAERNKMLLEISRLRREREHTAALLLESEQLLANILATEQTQYDIVVARLSEEEQVRAALAEQAHHLQHEVAALRASTSWRVTAPLRAVTRLLSPRR